MIQLARLSKLFGARAAVDDLSHTFSGPGLIAVLGPNGAGKTTLFDLIAGTTRPSTGTVSVLGKDPAQNRAVRQKLGVVMQDEFVLEGISCREYAELFSAIYGVNDGEATILADAGLADRKKTPVAALSGGQAARLFIAAALVHRPEVLLLDEPTAQLDPQAKRKLGAWLATLAKDRLVVMSTHDLDEAERLSDSVLILVGGKSRAHGTPRDLAGAGSFADAYFRACADETLETATAPAASPAASP